LLLLMALGCRKVVDVDPPQPDQLAPLETPNLAPDVPAEGDEVNPEAISFASGQEDDGVTWWGHAKANVAAPVSSVWACFQDPDAVVDRREVDEWTSEIGAAPEFDFSALIHNTVHDLTTVEFDLLWVHELQEGTSDAPEKVAVNWQKNDGASVIQLLVGSVVLTPVDGGATTHLEIEENLQALQRDQDTITSYEADLWASVAACAHGEPLPVYQ
jgi:hypothetical protein